MIPDFISVPGCSWLLLPPGVHDATLTDVYERFGKVSARREFLFRGLEKGLANIFASGCQETYLDGSYITSKSYPGDYEVCWSMAHVDPAILDPVFMIFDNGRSLQKQKYLGEYFPSLWKADSAGKTFLEFFQIDKETGAPKGIIRIKNN